LNFGLGNWEILSYVIFPLFGLAILFEDVKIAVSSLASFKSGSTFSAVLF
jgi:hypothetical protein